MYCERCGAPIVEGQIFCSICGTEIQWEASEQTEAALTPQPMEQEPEQKPVMTQPCMKQEYMQTPEEPTKETLPKNKQSKTKKKKQGKGFLIGIIAGGGAALIAAVVLLLVLHPWSQDKRNIGVSAHVTQAPAQTSTDISTPVPGSQPDPKSGQDLSGVSETVGELSFNTVTLDGTPIKAGIIEQYDLVIVNWWAERDDECVDELRDLERIHREYPNVMVLGVLSFSEDGSDVKDILASAGVTYPLMKPAGSLVSLKSQIKSVPTTLFFNNKGEQIEGPIAGSRSYEDWKVIVDKLLAGNTLMTAPTITTQPTAQTVDDGDKAVFRVVAEGDDLTYQWQYSKDNGSTWTNCRSDGYDTDTFAFEAAEALSGRLYRCVVKNDAGSVESDAALLTVNTKASAPKIKTQPANQTAAIGSNVTFTIVAEGTDLTYQWQYSKNNGATWTDWNGKTEDSVSIKASETNNGCLYRCIVKNDLGSVTSDHASLIVSNAKPVILTQPSEQTAADGSTVTFKVVAAGVKLTYQWQYSKDNGATWINCKSGAYNTDTFSFKAAEALSGRLYRCTVTNSFGSVNSSPVLFKIK